MTRKRQAPRSSPDVSLDASIVGVFGATGAGKSAYVKRRLAALPAELPAVVFDPGGEYQLGELANSERHFFQLVNDARLRVTFRPAADPALRLRQFDRFCLVGLAIARARGRCLVVVDELHLVTDAGAAPAGWHELVVTGRKLGVSIVAASIRPAAIDKDFWTCCTLVHAGRLNYIDDCKALANALGVDPRELMGLKSGGEGCDFIERDLLTGELRRGRLTF